MSFISRKTGSSKIAVQPRLARGLIFALGNLPIVLVGLPIPDWLFPPVASIVLFVLPGLAWVEVKTEESTIAIFVRIFARSVALIAGTIGLLYLLQITPTQRSWLALTLPVVSVGFLRKASFQNLKSLFGRLKKNFPRWIFLGFSCLFLYSILWVCALKFVPPMMDHDSDTQASAYGLIHSLTPRMVTDRGVLYDFSEAPLLSFQIGLVALARGSLGELAYPYTAAKTLAIEGGEFPREALWREAVHQARERFLADPHLLETRIPTLFFATATLPIFFVVLQGLTRSSVLSGMGCLLYFTFPEILVRSSHGGYTPMAIFFLLVMIYGYLRGERRTLWLGSFLGAIAKDQQTLILPLAIALWTGLRQTVGSWGARLRSAASHPALLGYLVGIVCFFSYGLLIHPQVFWIDHIRGHLWNRLFHIDTAALYPSVGGLWLQFNQVQGFPFLPLAAFSVVWLLIQSWNERSRQGAITLWAILGAFVFSIVDWRQTKHLMHIVPALVMATMAFISRQRGILKWSLVSLVGVVIFYNVWRIVGSWGNLLALHPTGDW